ncbi:MAG: DUF2059 domain-containing protein [Ferruginibacter sp.]
MMTVRIRLLISILLICSISTQAQKKHQKKATAAKLERVQEIEEDLVVTTLTVDTVGMVRPPGEAMTLEPTKTFDTTVIPNDELTRSIEKLIIEIDAVNSVIKMTGDLIKQKQIENTAVNLTTFLDRFYNELNSDEVRNYYHDLYIRLYRKYFNNDEIFQLTEFYKTTLGKKAYKSGLLIGNDAMIDGTKFGEYLAKKVFNEMAR